MMNINVSAASSALGYVILDSPYHVYVYRLHSFRTLHIDAISVVANDLKALILGTGLVENFSLTLSSRTVVLNQWVVTAMVVTYQISCMSHT